LSIGPPGAERLGPRLDRGPVGEVFLQLGREIWVLGQDLLRVGQSARLDGSQVLREDLV
jgi:hypothetical protein